MTKKQSRHWVCYYRVSTQRQGESGLGLDAQRTAVEEFVETRGSLQREVRKEFHRQNELDIELATAHASKVKALTAGTLLSLVV